MTATAHNAGTYRLAWLDVARGIAIILVVYGHQLRAQMFAGNTDPAWHVSTQDALIYSFHMPFFFFISGLTFENALNKRGLARLAKERALTLMYPYFLWSTISWVVSFTFSRQVNHSLSTYNVFELFWKPIFQYWFLYALFNCSIIGAVLSGRQILIFFVAVASLYGPVLTTVPIVIVTTAMFPFFAIGIIASRPTIRYFSSLTIGASLITLSAAIVMFLTMFNAPVCHSLYDILVKLFLSVFGIVMLLAIAQGVAGHSAWLATLGQASMAIFLLHTIISAAIRISLYSMGVKWPLLVLVLGTVGGVIIPVLIQRAVAPTRLARWLGFGQITVNPPQIPTV